MLEMLAQLLLSVDFLAAAIRFSTPLLGASLGEIISERSGVVNIGLEGMMLCGALGAVLGTWKTGNPFIGVLAAILAGLIVALILAFFSITLAVNQVVVGMALNIGSLGFTTFLSRLAFSTADSRPRVEGLGALHLPVLGDLPFLGPVFFNQSILVYITWLLIPIVGFLLMRTEWGLNLRAVGENPEASASLGLSVHRIRYTAVLICGAMAGFAGSFLSLVQLDTFVEGMTGGRGFIVLAVVIVGKWVPWRAMLAALLFGALEAIALRSQALAFKLPYELLLALPYLVTLLVYAGLVGQARSPEALGKAFVRD
ncbi:MAG: ABC transporter permease [Anaerolineales bacterium]|nr:ABC transporter permease [Anaerolineales bacterium]